MCSLDGPQIQGGRYLVTRSPPELAQGDHHSILCKWEPLVKLQQARAGRDLQSVQSLRCVRLFATPWTAARLTFLSITNSQSLLNLMSIESVMPSNHLILCCPLLLPPSIFPASGSFPMSQLFASSGQSIGVSASASVLPMNTQD